MLRASNDFSRYRNAEIISNYGQKYLESYEKPEISQDMSDRFITVEEGHEDRLDLIAWKEYGNPLYWWIIAIASNISNPLEVPVGTVLRIPDLYRALAEV